jgi:hypothetical protein
MHYVHQKDERPLPGNLQNRRYSFLSPPPKWCSASLLTFSWVGGCSLADFSTLKMEIRSSDTSVHTRSTRRHIPEDLRNTSVGHYCYANQLSNSASKNGSSHNRLERYYNSKRNQLAGIKNWKVALLLREVLKVTLQWDKYSAYMGKVNRKEAMKPYCL